MNLGFLPLEVQVTNAVINWDIEIARYFVSSSDIKKLFNRKAGIYLSWKSFETMTLIIEIKFIKISNF